MPKNNQEENKEDQLERDRELLSKVDLEVNCEEEPIVSECCKALTRDRIDPNNHYGVGHQCTKCNKPCSVFVSYISLKEVLEAQARITKAEREEENTVGYLRGLSEAANEVNAEIDAVSSAPRIIERTGRKLSLWDALIRIRKLSNEKLGIQKRPKL